MHTDTTINHESGVKSMKCTSPFPLRTRSERIIYIPCGSCMACRINRRSEWTKRLLDELMEWPKGQARYITLTYQDEYLPDPPSVDVSELQRYIKRVRKEIFPRKLRYYACGEYGTEKQRPHYHAILYGVGPDDDMMLKNQWWCTMDKKHGVKIGTVNSKSCGYVAGYICDKLNGEKGREAYQDKGLHPPFTIMSRYPIIGYHHLQKYVDNWLEINYNSDAGIVHIPRAYKRKIPDIMLVANYKYVKSEREEENVLEQRRKDIDTKIQMRRR